MLGKEAAGFEAVRCGQSRETAEGTAMPPAKPGKKRKGAVGKTKGTENEAEQQSDPKKAKKGTVDKDYIQNDE